MEVTDRARQAIDRGEQWKRAAMENLTPEAHAVELASMAAVDPTRGLVTIGHGEAEALLATAPEGDKIADALRLGLRRATGVDVGLLAGMRRVTRRRSDAHEPGDRR